MKLVQAKPCLKSKANFKFIIKLLENDYLRNPELAQTIIDGEEYAVEHEVIMPIQVES